MALPNEGDRVRFNAKCEGVKKYRGMQGRYGTVVKKVREGYSYYGGNPKNRVRVKMDNGDIFNYASEDYITVVDPTEGTAMQREALEQRAAAITDELAEIYDQIELMDRFGVDEITDRHKRAMKLMAALQIEDYDFERLEAVAASLDAA